MGHTVYYCRTKHSKTNKDNGRFERVSLQISHFLKTKNKYCNIQRLCDFENNFLFNIRK